MPDGWAWYRLISLYNFIDYRGKTPTKLTTGIPLVTAKNVKKGYICYTPADFISEAEYKDRQSRGVSKKGDLLFTTEAPLGNVALADLDEYSAGQRIITFQQYTRQNIFSNKLQLFFMLSPYFQNLLESKHTGSTVAGIKAERLKKLLLPLPPLAEQQRIMAQIETLLGYVDIIDTDAETLEKSITLAKQKILDLAIRGKLVPQDPTDEPASELLKKIKAEKEALVKAGKIKKDKHESYIFRGDDNCYHENIDGKVTDITDEIPFDLPDSWTWCRMGDAVEFIGGSQPPKSVFSFSATADSIRLIQIRDYKSDKYMTFIPKSQAKRFCSADDIMIGRYGPPIFQILRGLEEVNNLSEYLNKLKLNCCKFDITLARGQNYYTGNVFEVYDKNERIKGSIAAGGRYDEMIGNFIGDGEEYPTVGISFGLSAIYELLKKNLEKENSNTDIFIIPMETEIESLKMGVTFSLDAVEKIANALEIPFYLLFEEPTE